MGRGVRMLGRPLVHNEGRIEIGCDVTIWSSAAPVRFTTTAAGTIVVGDRVTLEPGVVIFSDAEVRIEDDVVIGPNVTICDRDARGVARPVTIGAGARIGATAQITEGCVVPRGVVVAPGTTFPVVEPASAPKRQPPSSTVRARALLVADFTIAELGQRLAEPDEGGFAIDAEIAPFDQVMPTLLSLGARPARTDLAFVWTRPEAISPGFRAVLNGEPEDDERVLSDVDAFASAIAESAAAVPFVFVASWVLPPWRRGLGMGELRSGPTRTLWRMNLRLAEALERATNVSLLDAQRWLADARDGGVDPKLWHAGKIGFTSDVFADAARDVRSALRGALGQSKKLVVVDLDDTLWGGVVGEVGWEGLNLGGHDADGEAFVQFQRQLVALTRRGVALAVVSKNDEATALAAMRNHPEMLVKPELLAAYRINWRDKASNIVEIARELNLGLQSVVFLDDNPVERGRVAEALPEVYVPAWPRDPTHYGRALESLGCFDTSSVTREDRERNATYAVERQRAALRDVATSLDDWLATLGVVVQFERLGEGNLARAAQLLNKTNQMNLRARRMSPSELLAWATSSCHEVWAVRVSDRFGDAGLTGLLGIARDGDGARLEDWVLSCRVMGRRVEETMLWAASKRAKALGANALVVEPVATKKNKPCIDFFERAHFPRDQGAWVIDLGAAPEAPALVKVEGLAP